MELQEIFEKLYEIFSTAQGGKFHRDAFLTEANLKHDLGVNSLDIVDIILGMETTFNIPEDRISEKDMFSFITVGDIMDFISNHYNPPKSLEAREIIKILPHEVGIIFVDRVGSVDLDMDQPQIRASKNVSLDACWASKHFPGDPIMPGVLIMEGLNQTAAILATLYKGEKKATGHFAGLNGKPRFKRPVRPGDILTYYVFLLHYRQKVFKFEAYAEVNGYEALTKYEILLSSAE